MIVYVLPALFAVLLWWSTTGVILYLDGLPRRTFRWTMGVGTGLLLVALAGLVATRSGAGLGSVYGAFVCGLAVWGWLQLAFYTGYLAGPRRRPCAPDCEGWRRTRHAVEATLYHELAIAACALGIGALTAGGTNRLGLWTFLLLWGMHVSAKLNVFLGVRNLNEEFFPEHLRYLESFLRRRPMNGFFPISVAVSVCLAILLVRRSLAPGVSEADAVAATLLATLTGLAILEHGFMVLPLPAGRLWEWGLRSREPAA